MSTEDEAKDLIRELTGELNAGNHDALGEFLADDYDELYDNDETVGELIGEERRRAEAFAGKHEELDVILTDTEWEEGEHLEAWYDVTGAHEGEFLDIPPTGTEVEFPLLRTFVIEDGCITRYRLVYTLGFLLDLGLDWETLTAAVDIREYLTSPKEAGSARA